MNWFYLTPTINVFEAAAFTVSLVGLTFGVVNLRAARAMERARRATGANGILLVVARLSVQSERWRLVLQAGLLGLAVAGFWTGPAPTPPVVAQNVVFLSLSIIALRLSIIGWHARRTIARLAAAEEEEGRG